MLSFLTVGKSILFDGLSKKPRRVLPARGTRHPQGGRAASGCPGRPQAANNFDRFLPRHVRGRKHFARSECRIVRFQRTTEAQNAANPSRESGSAAFPTLLGRIQLKKGALYKAPFLSWMRPKSVGKAAEPLSREGFAAFCASVVR